LRVRVCHVPSVSFSHTLCVCGREKISKDDGFATTTTNPTITEKAPRARKIDFRFLRDSREVVCVVVVDEGCVRHGLTEDDGRSTG